MTQSDRALREEITQAMEAIRLQADRLRSGPTIGGPLDDRSVLADLEAEYEALKEARARHGP